MKFPKILFMLLMMMSSKALWAQTIVGIPAEYDFGSVQVFNQSDTKIFEVQNIGNSDLVVESLSFAALGEESNFQLVDETCTVKTIPSGDNCFVLAFFSPQTLGSHKAYLRVFSNDPNAPSKDLIIVNGEGVGGGPNMAVDPTVLNFGTTTIGTSAELLMLVENVGTSQLFVNIVTSDNPAFSIVQNTCGQMAVNDICFIRVKYTPTELGLTLGAMNFLTNDPEPPVVNLVGSGVEALFTVEPPSPFDFGAVKVSESKAQNLTLTSVKNTPVEFGTISVQGPQASAFQILTNTCSNQTLNQDETCTISVDFRPVQGGPANAELLIPSNAVVTPTAYGLQGSGIGAGKSALVFNPAALNFSEISIQERKNQELKLLNPGEVAVTVNSVSLGGTNPGAFTQTNDCDGKVLNSGETCSVIVSFAAKEPGNFNALVIAKSGAENGENTAQLFGSTFAIDTGGSGCSLQTSNRVSFGYFWLLMSAVSVLPALILKKNLS